ncbi:glutamate-rich protein 1 [Brienomyrus brachyistius]|uniref:glutamate-rich protein 1 n=1 Tax=Brienomyrus brachyistius TaxID=42636 RepID=UPI0020B1CF4B|nr:glutamate-rich protein 1 [Brienomyrus brachyistius]
MASREEVFHKKVWGKLYPVPPRPEKNRSPKRDAEAAIEKPRPGIKAGKRPTTDAQDACQPHRRLYTVLPPPPGFVSNDKGSGPLPDTGVLNTDVHPADEDEEVFECGGQRRRRRRRVRKAGGDGAESPAVQAARGQEDEVTPTMAEDDPKLSRNKRRKLKKKRRKEKFLSLGLTPSAAALQFIYQPEDGSREGEEPVEDTQSNENQMAKLLEFLQATLEVYGRSAPDEKQQDLSPGSGAQVLLNGLFNRAVPPSDLSRLWRLRSLVLLRDVDRLGNELGQFQQSTTMGPGEVALICSLFRYWITDILPASGEQTAQTS